MWDPEPDEEVQTVFEISRKTVRGRKPHTCDRCGGTIPPGKPHERVFCKDDWTGEVGSYRQHLAGLAGSDCFEDPEPDLREEEALADAYFTIIDEATEMTEAHYHASDLAYDANRERSRR